MAFSCHVILALVAELCYLVFMARTNRRRSDLRDTMEIEYTAEALAEVFPPEPDPGEPTSIAEIIVDAIRCAEIRGELGTTQRTMPAIKE